MARLIFLFAPYPAPSHLFTIDRAVGNRGVNNRHDVLLVQFFLRALIPTPPGAPTIPLDGHCGKQTINWIRYFQAAYGDTGAGVPEAGQRDANQNNFQQGGLTANIADGSVRFVGGGSSKLPAVQDGSSNTIIVGRSPTIQDGSSNTILIGEQPPADADSHVHRHYGAVRPPSYGEPFDARMTIVRLNMAYREAYGAERFRRLDLDPSFPPELFSAFFGILHAGKHPREAASRGSGRSNLRQIGL